MANYTRAEIAKARRAIELRIQTLKAIQHQLMLIDRWEESQPISQSTIDDMNSDVQADIATYNIDIETGVEE